MTIPKDIIEVIKTLFPKPHTDIINRFDPYLIFGADWRGEYLSVIYDEIKEHYLITIFTSGYLTNTKNFYVDFESKKTHFAVTDSEDLKTFLAYYEKVYDE